jgi:hypothetical protein
MTKERLGAERDWPARLQEAFARADKFFSSYRADESIKSSTLQDFSPMTAAIHEVGHGVVTHRLGGQVRIIEIGQWQTDRGGWVNGRTRMAWRDSATVEQMVMGLLAGPIAHLRVDTSDSGLTFIREDRNEINRLVAATCVVDGDHDIARELEWRARSPDMIKHTAALVEENWPLIERVAEVLLERKHLTGSQFVKALARPRQLRKSSEARP